MSSEGKEGKNGGNNSSVIRLFDRIASGSAETLSSGAGTIIDTTTKVPRYATNVVSGITSNLPLRDLYPDIEKVDKLVETSTYVMYAFGTFSVIGSIYFSMKTIREIGQWRQWYKYRRLIQQMHKN